MWKDIQFSKTVPAQTATFPYADDVSAPNVSSFTSSAGAPTHPADFRQPFPVAFGVTYVSNQPRMGPRHFITSIGHRLPHQGRGTQLPNSNANVLSRESYHNNQPSRPHSNMGIRFQTNMSEQQHQQFVGPGQVQLNVRPGQMQQSTRVMSFGNVEASNTNLPMDMQNVFYSADPNALIPGVQASHAPMLQQTYQEPNQLHTNLQGLQTDQSFIQFHNFAQNQNPLYPQTVFVTGGQNTFTSAQQTDLLQQQFQTENTDNIVSSASTSDACPGKGTKMSKVDRKRKSAMVVDTRLFKTKPGRRPKPKQHRQDNQHPEADELEDIESLQKDRLKLQGDTLRIVNRSKKKITFGRKKVKQRNRSAALMNIQSIADEAGSADAEEEEPEKQTAFNTGELVESVMEKGNCPQNRKRHSGRTVPKAKGQTTQRTLIGNGVTTNRMRRKVLGRAMTPAEKQKAYRLRKMQREGELYRQRERERSRRYYKPIGSLPWEQRQKRRQDARINSHNYRLRRKLKSIVDFIKVEENWDAVELDDGQVRSPEENVSSKTLLSESSMEVRTGPKRRKRANKAKFSELDESLWEDVSMFETTCAESGEEMNTQTKGKKRGRKPKKMRTSDTYELKDDSVVGQEVLETAESEVSPLNQKRSNTSKKRKQKGKAEIPSQDRSLTGHSPADMKPQEYTPSQQGTCITEESEVITLTEDTPDKDEESGHTSKASMSSDCVQDVEEGNSEERLLSSEDDGDRAKKVELVLEDADNEKGSSKLEEQVDTLKKMEEEDGSIVEKEETLKGSKSD